MPVHVGERLVAHLQCICPNCQATLEVHELRQHFITCTATNSNEHTRRSVTIPSPVATVIDPADDTVTTQRSCSTFASASNPALCGTLENRLNTIEERLQSLLATYPGKYELSMLHLADRGSGKIYRSSVTFHDGIGFYFATSNQKSRLALWFTNADRNRRCAAEGCSLTWQVTVECGDSMISRVIRDPQIGGNTFFQPFHEVKHRGQVVLTVTIEKLPS